MKKIILLFVLIPFGLFSQKDTTASPIKFDFVLTPELNNLIVGSFGTGTITPEAKFGFSSTVNFRYNFNERIAISAGLGYGRKNYAYKHTGLIFNSDIDPQLGAITESSLDASIALNEFHLPVIVRLSTGKFYITGGVEFDYQQEAKNKRVIHYGNGTEETLNSSLDPILNYSASFGIGYTFKLSEKMDLALEPVLKTYFQESMVFNSRTYSIGLKTVFSLGN